MEEKKRRKFLFATFEALSNDLAWQLVREGHQVKFYCKSETEKDVGEGFFELIDDWEKYIGWADVIIFDDIGFGAKADQLRREGKFVVGGSAYTDKLEMDREFGQNELKDAGVAVLPRRNFTSFDEAIAFVKANPDKWVIKPSGIIQNEKELLYVGEEEDGSDVIDVLEKYREGLSKKMKEFLLQKRAEGVEVAVDAFFNGKDFVLPCNINFENKRLFPNDLGPNTGEQGTFEFWTKNSPIFDSVLKKMKDKLVAAGYVGEIDLNCIANSRGIWPLEFTSRFGYPELSMEIEAITNEWGQFLYDLAHGLDPQLKAKKGFDICVVVAIPPWPYDDAKTFKRYSEGIPILFKRQNRDGVRLGEVKCKGDNWYMAGESGYALVVSANGATMDDAIHDVYQRVRNIVIPNVYYRDDIGQRWYKDGDMLLSWGYI